jgi:RHS repeat-associated protein
VLQSGNLLYITDGEKMAAYTYYGRNRLIQSGRMKYRYNWRNERIETVWKGKVTRYVVDDSSELSKVLMEQNCDGKVIAYYVYGLGLIGREDGATGQYQSYHSDIRGSTTFLTDEKGKISDRYSYGYYGEVFAYEGSTHQPFQYNGRDGVMHDANGLYYMRARYYHPELKRFLNRDVLKGDILEGQTLNRYAYVNGDPVSYVDPLGLEKQMVKSSSVGSGKEYKVSEARREHILVGDPPGTGHGPNRGNTTGAFPDTWTDDQTISAIERVVNNPNSTWKQATGSGYVTAPITVGGPSPHAPTLTNNGMPVRYKVQGQDHGLNIEVIVAPQGEGIVTGYNKGVRYE